MSVRAAEPFVALPARRTGIAGWPHSLRRFARTKPLGAIAAVLVIVMVFLALFGRLIVPHDPVLQLGGMKWASALTIANDGGILWLGGDDLGRDEFARVVVAARVAVQIGLMAISIGIVIGVTLGLISGYWGGWVDMFIQRIMDSLMAFPGLVLAMMIVAVLKNGLIQVALAIGVLMIPYACRVVRGTVLSAKQNMYVDAARASGARDIRILIFHVLPNVAAPIIILAATYFSAAILAESTLSFLGLGTQPPEPSWGQMIRGASQNSIIKNQLQLVAPCVFLSLTVLGFNLLGDSLRDVWDPKLRGR